MDEIDRSEMTKAIKGMYAAANLKEPRIVFAPSPFVARFAAGFAAAIWYNRKNKTTFGQIDGASATDSATLSATYSATYSATRSATRSATLSATVSATYSATDSATRSATDSATYSATRSATADKNSSFIFDIKGMVNLSLRFNVGKFGILCAERAWSMWQGGNFWSGWTAFLTFFRYVAKLDIDYSKFEHWEKATIHGSVRFVALCLVACPFINRCFHGGFIQVHKCPSIRAKPAKPLCCHGESP